MGMPMCEVCQSDARVKCKRDSDVRCLICGMVLCGGHVLEHLRIMHCVATDNAHCAEPYRDRELGT